MDGGCAALIVVVTRIKDRQVDSIAQMSDLLSAANPFINRLLI